MIVAMTGMLDPEETKIILRRNSLLGEMSKCPFADENMRGLMETIREAKGSSKDKKQTNP